jgi:putative membrane-bound dehydrogenase-like protein
LVRTTLAADAAATGPDTEKRFPKLIVPDGFQTTLFACDPLVEYPSVIAIGPEPRTLFVAHDYVTGLGIEIIRRDEIRLLRDTDGDGYADASTVFAKEFNSIQGLAFHGDTVYAMHAPLLTSLRDTNQDGIADERRDLFGGLGLPPEENDNRLHCANGVVVGHDGWLYLALGDRGCDVRRPEGDRLLFQEGGILRCRVDGRDLHVFSRGLRNIYDVVLDDELNVFVRDNENDGGDYMIRVCHCFHGSDHGYPYLYRERPDEAMKPLADLGRGSSAGGTAYLEAAFPQEFRESLFFCEWGRAVVRYRKQPAGSGFSPMQEVDFAAGAPTDPYGFKPTDLVVDRDGSLLISDWCDGQRPKRGRGRIYRISYRGESDLPESSSNSFGDGSLEEAIKSLDSKRYHIRVAAQESIERQGTEGVRAVEKTMRQGGMDVVGRLHAVWILAHASGKESLESLFRLAERDPDARVQTQAVRAIADLTDPILVNHRLGGERGDEAICQRLSKLGAAANPLVRREVMIALGRLHWADAPQWLGQHWSNSDLATGHAAMVLLRRAENWPAVLQLLDDPDAKPSQPDLRAVVLRTLANQADPIIVDGLVSLLKNESRPVHRAEYFDLLTRVYKKPAEWTYWGFRPAPRPANTVAWDRTSIIEQSLEQALTDKDDKVRIGTARRMLREDIPISNMSLQKWLKNESNQEGVTVIVEAASKRPIAESREIFETIVRGDSHSNQNRIVALTKFSEGLDADSEKKLLAIVDTLPDGPVLAAAMDELGKRPGLDASSLLLARIESSNQDVRAAAVRTLTARPVEGVVPHLGKLLRDPDIRVRRAAANLCGKLGHKESLESLLAFANELDFELRSASLDALRKLGEARAIPQAIEALRTPETQIAALNYLADFGGPDQIDVVADSAGKSRSIDVLKAAVGALRSWRQKHPNAEQDLPRLRRAIATIHGESGMPLEWKLSGPVTQKVADQTIMSTTDPEVDLAGDWKAIVVEGNEGQIRFGTAEKKSGESAWLAVTDLYFEKPESVEFLGSAQGKWNVWIDGERIFQRETASANRADSDRFDAKFPQGLNRVLVRVEGETDCRFQLRFRRKSSEADFERLMQFALKEAGNVDRGRELFTNADKSLCAKCHRLGEQGARIGPDLAGIGSRFSRVHLIESILEPSRTVAPSYETWGMALSNGKVLAGVKIAETATMLTLGDDQGKTHEIQKSEIDEAQAQPKSTMPDGLHKKLTDREFVDLIEFLLSQKKPR